MKEVKFKVPSGGEGRAPIKDRKKRCHSREGGNPSHCEVVIPDLILKIVIPAKAGIHAYLNPF